MTADWTQRSRPFFTIFGPTERVTPDSVERRVRAARDAHCDAVMCFVESDGYALWPSNVVERSSYSSEIDPIKTMVESAHAQSMRFVAEWMGCHCQSLHVRQHPSWMQRDAADNPAPAMCLNSPYADLLLEEVDEVLNYDVDAVYFDGLYARFGGCYCDACQAQFRSVYGHRMPRPALTAPPVEPARREHWLEFSVQPTHAEPELDAFRFATVANFCRRVRSLLDHRRPGTQFILDTLGVTTAYYANGHDLARMAESVDVFLLESYWDNLREPVWHVGMECALVRSEAGTPIWWPRWLARHPDGDQVSVPAATVRIWAGQALAHDASPAPVEQNLYTVDRSLEVVVSDVLGRVERAQKALNGARRAPYAMLLHSEATKRAFAPAQRPRDYFDAFAGAYSALQEAHLPFEVVSDRMLDEGDPPPDTRVVVLPNTVVLSPRAVDALTRFVHSGGGLVASFRAGFGSAEESALGRLLGFRSMGVGFRNGRVGPETYGGREPVNYYRVTGQHQLTAGLDERMFSFRGAYLRVDPAPGVTVCAELLDYDFIKMDGDRFFSWYPGAPSTPLLITSEHGAGRVAYFSAPLDAVFFRQGWPEAADLLVRAAQWAAGAAPALSIEAPPTVDARIHTATEQTLVVLANRTSHDLYALGRDGGAHTAPGSSTARAHFARALIPVADVVIGMDWPAADVPPVATISGVTPEVRLADGRLEVRLPRLNDFDLVRIGGTSEPL